MILLINNVEKNAAFRKYSKFMFCDLKFLSAINGGTQFGIIKLHLVNKNLII